VQAHESHVSPVAALVNRHPNCELGRACERAEKAVPENPSNPGVLVTSNTYENDHSFWMTLWKSVYQFRETAMVNCENPGKNRQDRPILLGERSSVGIRASEAPAAFTRPGPGPRPRWGSFVFWHTPGRSAKMSVASPGRSPRSRARETPRSPVPMPKMRPDHSALA
jgi:hypothetical protein